MVAAEPVVEQPAMSVSVTAPQRTYHVGDRPRFTIEAVNTGTAIPAREVQIEATFEEPLRADKTTPGGQPSRDGKGVVFTIPMIPPGKTERREIECVCVAPAQQACGRVVLTDLSKLPFAAEGCVQILPAAAAAARQSNLRLQIKPTTNPVRLGGDATFRITVTNSGATSERQVRIAIRFPESLPYVGSTGSVREANNDGLNIQFQPIMELRPGESIPLDLRFRAKMAGPAQVTVEATSPTLDQPLTEAATVNIFAE
jgi:hypothetical protein